MSKTKLLVMSVIALIVLNISLLIIGGMKKSPLHGASGPRPNIKHIVANKLSFDKAQQASYEELIKVHQPQVKNEQDKISKAKDKLYRNLITNDDTIKQQMLDQISAGQSKIERIHYQHFIDIKNLCTADQLDQFNELQSELGRLFKKGPPRKR